MEELEYKIGDRFANITEWGNAIIYEIIAIAPTLDDDGMRIVFVKEIQIPLDQEGNEETTEPRTLTYSSYYDYVVAYGDKIEKGKSFYGGLEID